MKNKMMRKRVVFLGALGLLCAMSGCGKTSGNGQEEEIIRIEASADDDGQQKESGRSDEKGQPDAGSEPQTEQEAMAKDSSADRPDNAQDETELEGDVISIGEDSMVVSKIDTYVEDGNAVAVSDLSEDAALITVFFSENTEFIVKTVKNGGVNGGSDVEKKAGTSADLQEGRTVLMTGSCEGEDFRAEQVIIYHFV